MHYSPARQGKSIALAGVRECGVAILSWHIERLLVLHRVQAKDPYPEIIQLTVCWSTVARRLWKRHAILVRQIIPEHPPGAHVERKSIGRWGCSIHAQKVFSPRRLVQLCQRAKAWPAGALRLWSRPWPWPWSWSWSWSWARGLAENHALARTVVLSAPFLLR